MARRAYFAFHYQRDITRVNVVRNSWVTQDREAAGFYDASLWESSKRQGDEAIRRMINRGLDSTSVTVVLLGTETSKRQWVRYEIEQSHKRGNGLLGVCIHNIRYFSQMTSSKGANPFDTYTVTDSSGRKKYLSTMYHTYDWVVNDGYSHIVDWIERAALNAGK